ncbi:hypothetical protein IC575_014413 [Cucumis melo]
MPHICNTVEINFLVTSVKSSSTVYCFFLLPPSFGSFSIHSGSYGTMSLFLSGFKDTDVLFLEFDDKLSNVGGSFRWVTIQMRLNLLRLLGDVNSFDSLN